MISLPGRVPIKEKEAQRAILDWLSAKKIFHYRQKTGAVKTETRFFRFGTKGSPDIVAVIAGRYVGIEVEGSNGRARVPSRRTLSTS